MLVEQLGVMRFGRRPIVADTFAGGGSIPFEAARIGCDVYASDLNPVANMLTWGSSAIIGASSEARRQQEARRVEVARKVDAEVTRLGIEHDAVGNRAKAYLYCLEVKCPATGWMVPLVPSWVISKTRNVVAKLIPDSENNRYIISIETGVDATEMLVAEKGTVREGRLVHPMNPDADGVLLATVRGDYKVGTLIKNRLRQWSIDDFMPARDDIFQERLYCIQWINKDSFGKKRQETFFAQINEDDLRRETEVQRVVREKIASWQAEGLVPDTMIEPGEKTSEPIRTRGWTHWHHLFVPRQLLIGAMVNSHVRDHADIAPMFAKVLDYGSRLCRWDGGHPGSSPQVMATFTNQALNTLLNFGVKAASHAVTYISAEVPKVELGGNVFEVRQCPAGKVDRTSDIYITDPPYADAVNYHEITEYFIAWLRKRPPRPLNEWTWDSRRRLAIKGKGEEVITQALVRSGFR